MLYIVDVYYNKNMMSMLRGYQDTDELECVLHGIVVDAMSMKDACERVFTDMQDLECMRSMSMGDVLFVHEDADGVLDWHWYACSTIGFTAISVPDNNI